MCASGYAHVELAGKRLSEKHCKAKNIFMQSVSASMRRETLLLQEWSMRRFLIVYVK